ncbi:MAG: T9SS type A sorting domain-containing protein [Bacteroidetes bacterium]|uniref:ELWxxDGT repeat protein n=1 Tax=Phnomibacter sp. TaxID=2836217 RepID=UPI002FDC8DAD|nr:T9SS type A sorting domain-containing protein [Bacteroidota bacterium]
MKKCFITLVVFFALCVQLFAQSFSLVKDYTPGAPTELIVYNGKVYFKNSDGVVGNELFVTDGTSAGTNLVKDIRPGSANGGCYAFSILNNKMYFFSGTAANGVELFESDGTNAGTVLVKDINPGAGSSGSAFFATLNGIRYFDAQDGPNGLELWRTDGTTAGTYMVKDIVPGAGSSFPANLTTVGNKIFFWAYNALSGVEMWVSDGTAAGTMLLKDIYAGVSPNTYEGTQIGNLNDVAYFAKNDGINGVELWRSDGTTAGTYMVKDISSGPTGSNPFNFIVFNNELYFIATEAGVSKLWKTNGTQAGTVALATAAGTHGNGGMSMVVFQNKLYFYGTDATHGSELWKTDGTIPGTVLVKDINPGISSSSLKNLTNIGDKIIFSATTPTAGAEPWVSNGTEMGTLQLQDIEPGVNGSNIEQFTIVGSKLFATAQTLANERDVYVINDFVALPLRFISFTAKSCTSATACLEWKTADEVQVAYFDIERSTDGVNYSKTGRVVAKNGRTNSYSFTDDIASLQHYTSVLYRIRQVDVDGKFSYSKTSSISNAALALKVFPSITNSSFTVQYNGLEKMHIVVRNNSGSTLLNKPLLMGSNTIQVQHFSAGTYLYSIVASSGDVIKTGKIVKQ